MGEGSLRRGSKSPTKATRGGDLARGDSSRRTEDASASPSTHRVGRSVHRAPLPSTSSPRRLPSSSSSPRKLPTSASSRIPQASVGIPPVPPLPNLPSFAGIPSLVDIPLVTQGPRSPPVPPHTPHERAVPVPIPRVPSTEGPVKMFYAASVISMSTVDGEEGVVAEKEEGTFPAEEEASSSPVASPSPPTSPVAPAASSPSPSTPRARSRPPSITTPPTPDAEPEATFPAPLSHQRHSRSPSPRAPSPSPSIEVPTMQTSARGASSSTSGAAGSEGTPTKDDASLSMSPSSAPLPAKTGSLNPRRSEQDSVAAADVEDPATSTMGDALQSAHGDTQALAAENDDHDGHLSDTGRPRIGRITVPPWLEGSVPSRDPRIRAEVEALRKAAKVGRVKGAKEI
ncbi:hypothetical protein K525DRAFT_362017 [Schizophyllum commune Loenen D]|nr:hypothetical protein K525DRAFT_362017 [Schizophyllum commune Loenen D]